jgi:2-iminobutanoate/2-iminopropanoate deaminase
VRVRAKLQLTPADASASVISAASKTASTRGACDREGRRARMHGERCRTRRAIVRLGGAVAVYDAAVAKSRAARPIGPYSPVVRAGDWIIVSGQLGLKGGVLVKGGVKAQTAQAIENLRGHLATEGATLADVRKTMCFLADMDTFATFNEAYVAGFGDSRPARSTVGVAALPAGGAVEIEAWAWKPSRRGSRR